MASGSAIRAARRKALVSPDAIDQNEARMKPQLSSPPFAQDTYLRTYLRAYPRSPAAGGFTLIELIVTIAIVAILIMIAAPSLRDAMLNVQLSAQANDIQTDLSMARSEAVRRRVQTGVCTSDAAGTACAGTNTWQNGWLVFIDADSNGNVDPAAGSVIKRQQAFDGKNTLALTNTGTTKAAYVAFGAGGTVVGGAQPMFFTLCDARKQGKTISISLAGRAAVEKAPPKTCP